MAKCWHLSDDEELALVRQLRKAKGEAVKALLMVQGSLEEDEEEEGESIIDDMRECVATLGGVADCVVKAKDLPPKDGGEGEDN
jgi:hypothetical protein